MPDQNGKMRRLADYQGQKVILYLYSNNMTAGYTKQASAFSFATNEAGKIPDKLKCGVLSQDGYLEDVGGEQRTDSENRDLRDAGARLL